MTFLISVVAQSTTIFLRCGVHCNTPSSTRLSTRYFASGREQSLLSVISLRRFVIYQLPSQITGFSASSGMAPFYMDRFLPFGLRTAPFLFDLFAKALHWILVATFCGST